MQSNIKTICKSLAKDKNLNEDLLKAVASSVFKELHDVQNLPPNLIIKLKGVGSWFLRKQQMERKIAFLEEEYKYSTEPPPTEMVGKYWENKAIKELLEKRLEDYKTYLEQKSNMRQRRVDEGFTMIVELEDNEED